MNFKAKRGKKLNFFSDRWIMLNFRPSHREYFFLQNYGLWTKIGIKKDEISQKYQNLNNVFIVFFRKIDSFLFDFTQ